MPFFTMRTSVSQGMRPRTTPLGSPKRLLEAGAPCLGEALEVNPV